ncbi:aminopeptidase N [Sphingomonas sp. SORGH_AS802]|uniref:M1 family metallopeptidase n=1 Tax=unclassified Sphingomonas TaxID=196159 RepID=UPI002866B72B|nr:MULTISPECIES: M1 family metallopeptidase [unclassified Sphingomonas]MDR6127319.1 aminopeptidase N [Sphingomonas sp. SORGH_AS_0438]MDR6133764.1 aminopeptidase N [Sphingomonas sp. SORGH_AS_0802]
MFVSLLAPIALLAASAPLDTAPPAKGTPPVTAQTKRSGGVRPPEQLAMRFDSADLAFELLPDRYRLEGVATLGFTATAPLDRLVIDLDRNLPVRAIAIDDVDLPATAWSNPEGQLVVRLPRPLAAGQSVRARITYGGTPHVAVRAPWDDGVVWSKTKDGRTWFGTTAEGYGCDLFWPCLDFPKGEPAVVTLHITVPKGLKAPSNGVLLGVDTLPDGRSRWNWRIAHPNTYGIALNVGPYEEISGTYKSRFGNRIPMFYWYLPGEKAQAEKLFAEFAPTLDFFESVIGPYPFGDEKVGVVETPYKGMEHQTINAYGNDYAKAIEGFDWLFQHEFSHEWFGNQLTAANWDDYWLHEGYGSYMQPAYGRWREGEARYAAMMQGQRGGIANQVPIVRGRVITEEEVYEAEDGGPGLDIYNKGSWMLHTLRGLIGDAAFWDVTRLAVYGRTDPKPGNFQPRFGSTAEYERFVRQVTGQDYGWFFDVYLRRAALPELVTERSGDRMTLRWKVPGNGPFPLPVEVQVGDRITRVAMAGGRGELAVPADAHVVIDPFARVLMRSTAVEELQAWRSGRTK